MKHFTFGLAYAGSLFSLTAETTNSLADTTITAQSPDFISSIEASEARIATIPGAASIVNPSDWTGRTVKPAEIFQFNPSVYAQSGGTANDTRLSIRGSGIQRRFGSRGISILQDGIPANNADGSFYTRIIDPESLAFVDVFPGANGFIYGANQLGGAINFVQKNGITAPGASLTAEYGSFETFRGSAQYGVQEGKWDFFAGYSYTESDGYRDQQNYHTHHFTANLGYQWSDKAQTRFYFLFNDSDAALAGSLTPDEFADDPAQAAPGRDSRTDRDLSTIRLSQRTAWDLKDAKYSFYTYYQYLDFDHLTGIGVGQFNNLIDYDTDEFGLGLTGENNWNALNLNNTLRSTISYDYGRNEVGGFSGFVPFPGATPGTNDRDDEAENFKIYVENDTQIADSHHFYLGAGWVNARRKRDIGSENTSSTNESFTEVQDGGIWRVGYLNNWNAHTQLFANISQSFEAAPFSEADDAVKPQKAITYEIGTRYQKEWLTAHLTGYFSEVNDEFIDVETAPNSGRYATTNEDTIHKGLEVFASVDLTDAFELSTNYTLTFDQSYQLNDFEFDGGIYDGNQIPGISEHVYAGRLRLTAPEQKWSTAISADWLPNGLDADNANTKSTDGYTIWRLYAEYSVTKSLKLYGGIDNLFDEEYASTVSINPSSDAFINPGDGRSAYIGAKFAW